MRWLSKQNNYSKILNLGALIFLEVLAKCRLAFSDVSQIFPTIKFLSKIKYETLMQSS